MKRNTPLAFLTVFFLIFSISVSAQTETDKSTEKKNTSITQAKVLNIDAFDPVKYPSKAIRKGIEGKLVIRIEVDEKGGYQGHSFEDTAHELLIKAVEPYIAQLTFKPASMGPDSAAIASVKIIEFHFKIERKLPPKTDISINY